MNDCRESLLVQWQGCIQELQSHQKSTVQCGVSAPWLIKVLQRALDKFM